LHVRLNQHHPAADAHGDDDDGVGKQFAIKAADHGSTPSPPSAEVVIRSPASAANVVRREDGAARAITVASNCSPGASLTVTCCTLPSATASKSGLLRSASTSRRS